MVDVPMTKRRIAFGPLDEVTVNGKPLVWTGMDYWVDDEVAKVVINGRPAELAFTCHPHRDFADYRRMIAEREAQLSERIPKIRALIDAGMSFDDAVRQAAIDAGTYEGDTK